jgi:hypothetical protein
MIINFFILKNMLTTLLHGLTDNYKQGAPRALTCLTFLNTTEHNAKIVDNKHGVISWSRLIWSIDGPYTLVGSIGTCGPWLV